MEKIALSKDQKLQNALHKLQNDFKSLQLISGEGELNASKPILRQDIIEALDLLLDTLTIKEYKELVDAIGKYSKFLMPMLNLKTWRGKAKT
jgi:hypothetical protein